jgi:AcrR family transcriptional regulator
MGLRSDKQQSQRSLILENSIALFESRGFARVPVREVAAACSLSEGTFFNYFSSKEAVLREWAALGFEAAFVRAAGDTPARPVRRVARRWAGELSVWAMSAPETMALAWSRIRVADLGAVYTPARGRPASPDPLQGLIERGQAQQEIRADLASGQLAQLLRAALAQALVEGTAAAETLRSGSLERSLTRALDLLLDGFRKRNERVPAPGQAGSSKSSRRERG